MSRGLFVVLEGGDACGKSTQQRRLVEYLRSLGRDVVSTFEPGATAMGARIRELMLGGDEHVEPMAEALLMAADRAQHVAEVVLPALERGADVVSDRFLPSSLAYQGVAREIGVDEVAEANRFATRGLTPDLVIVVDVPEEVARERRSGRPDRMERESRAFHERVRQAYRDLAPRFGWAVVDGSDTPEEVATRIHALVTRRI
ncbi:MAG: dTMP kinase [Acidimicrobiia bacterium]